MGLEAATYVSDLVATNPVLTDKRHLGDDHLRLVKGAIKASLPKDLRNVSGPNVGDFAVYSLANGGGFANSSADDVKQTLRYPILIASYPNTFVGGAASSPAVNGILKNTTGVLVSPGAFIPAPWTLTSGGYTRILISFDIDLVSTDPGEFNGSLTVGIGTAAGDLGTASRVLYIPTIYVGATLDRGTVSGSHAFEFILKEVNLTDPWFLSFWGQNFSSTLKNVRLTAEKIS